MRHNQLPLDGPLPTGCVTDVSQGWAWQTASGRNTLMTRSVLFAPDLGRILLAKEHPLLMGWDVDISFEGLTAPWSQEVRDHQEIASEEKVDSFPN